MSIYSDIEEIAKEAIACCHKFLNDLSLDHLQVWHRHPPYSDRKDLSDEDIKREIEFCQFEFGLFFICILYHYILRFSPIKHRIALLLWRSIFDRFEDYTTHSFPLHCQFGDFGVLQHVWTRIEEYDLGCVVRAAVESDASAQDELCERLLSNLPVRPTSDDPNFVLFRQNIFNSLLIHDITKILDLIYRFNERYNRFIEENLDQSENNDSIWKIVDNSDILFDAPRIDDKTNSAKRESAKIMLSGILPHSNLAAILNGAAVVFSAAIAFSAGMSLCANFSRLDLNAVLTYVGIGVASMIVVDLFKSRLAAARAAVEAIKHGRYVLYLRSSSIDIWPPYPRFRRLLLRVLSQIAPVIAVGLQERILVSGIANLGVLPDWESKVATLISGSTLCVYVASPRRGYDRGWGKNDDSWKEVESITSLTEPGRFLIYFPKAVGDYPHVLIHPKGDRMYGVSTLVHEVRRLINSGTSGYDLISMGAAEWLWWSTDGTYRRLLGDSVASDYATRAARSIAPIVESLGRGQKAKWKTPILVLCSIPLGLILLEYWSRLLANKVSLVAILIAAFVIVLWRVCDWALDRLSTREYMNYVNAVRPLPTDELGLSGVNQEKHHPSLTH